MDINSSSCSHLHNSEIDEQTVAIQLWQPVHMASHYSMSLELQAHHCVSRLNQQTATISATFPEAKL